MYFKPKRNWAQEFDEREDAREEARQERLRKEREERESIKPGKDENQSNENKTTISHEVQTRGNSALKSAPITSRDEIVYSLNDIKNIEREVAISIAQSTVKVTEDVYKLFEGPNGQLCLFAPILKVEKTAKRTRKYSDLPPRRVSDLYYDALEVEF